MTLLGFKGFIRDINYIPHLNRQMPIYSIDKFDINLSGSCGIVTLNNLQNNIAFSKWVSPKRTRSYPFARIYNTYHLNTKRVTIIPIIKDEGNGTGNNDRINSITFSWMNLLNVYIILGWYEDADVVLGTVDRITNQKLSAEYIKNKIFEISSYQMTALHWNTTHFQRDFCTIYLNAVDSYEKISQNKAVALHSPNKHLEVLERFKKNEKFDIETFKQATLLNSFAAANREVLTTHAFEHLGDGSKGIFSISNYLGGEYHLTADEIYEEDNLIIIQESKNSSNGKLPAEDDIKDGLFKLILFANLETLFLADVQINFIARLKMTGNIEGYIHLPNTEAEIKSFCRLNNFNKRQIKLLELLNRESSNNSRLSILVTGRN